VKQILQRFETRKIGAHKKGVMCSNRVDAFVVDELPLEYKERVGY
jgi:hypothetical protein